MKINLIRLLAVLIVVSAIFLFYLNFFAPATIPGLLKIGIIRKPLNILILGTDMTFNAETGKPMPNQPGRADTIMLVRFNPIKSRISALSIPRDTYLEIPGYGWQKVNAANAFGGTALMMKTIELFTKQKIDYFFELKPTTITKIVDLLGGVYIDVEKDMRYTDRAQGLDINLKKGYQKLSGQAAHDYIRFRHDLFGDIGRIKRQQKFLKALSQALTRPANIIKAPFVIRSALRETQTNLPLTVTFRLLNWGRTLSSQQIESEMIAGETIYTQEAGSIWQTDRVRLEEQLKKLF
ncbi:MAG: LCP family protein [bacterium]